MKWFALVLVLVIPGALMADVSVQNGKITADFESLPLQQILEQLRTQTDVAFNIDEGIGSTQVSASFQDLPLAEGIKKMLEGTGVNFAVVAGASGSAESIYIGSSEKPGTPGNKPPTQYRVVQPPQPQMQPQQIYQQPDLTGSVDPNNPNNQRPQPPGWQKKMEDQRNQMKNNNLPPTGGGFNPNPTAPQPKPGIQPPPDTTNPDDVTDESDDESDEE